MRVLEQDRTVTQIRIPQTFDNQVNYISQRDGISKNSTMLMLMRLGLRLYEAVPQISINLSSGSLDLEN